MIAAAPCAAQSGASIAISAGNATDITGTGSSALTVAPSITGGDALSSRSIGATATKFANDAWSAGLNAAFTARGKKSFLTPAIDIAATAATTSQKFSYAGADLVPSAELTVGGVRLFGGGRLGFAATSAAQALPAGPVGQIPNPDPKNASATAATVIGGLSFTAASSTGELTTVGYRAEGGRVAGRAHTDHVVSAAFGGSHLILSGAIGRRVTPLESMMHGTLGLTVPVAPSIALQLAAGKYPANAMLGTAAGKFVNAGISMSLGRKAGTMPAPAGVPRPGHGMTRIAIRARDARRVELGGDFTKWQLVPTTRADDGVWYADLALSPGDYRYAFRIDGKEWRVPEGVAAADDEFGGKSAWLTVRKDARSTSK